MSDCSVYTGNEWHTWAMRRYSGSIENRFMPRLTSIASSVEIPSTKPIKKGPRSLQIRSMRRICEFIADEGVELGLDTRSSECGSIFTWYELGIIFSDFYNLRWT